MSEKINFETSLGEFVVEYPQTRDVFEKYGLDYCCGGQKNITEAAKEKYIEMDVLKALLQKVIDETPKNKKAKNWSNESLVNIIEHIEKTHHEFTWEKLSSCEMLLEKLIEAHGDKHGYFLLGLQKVFADFKIKLEKHLLIEEDIIFNYVRILESSFDSHHKKSARDPRFNKEIINILNKEHEEAGEILTQLRTITSDYELPDYACLSFEKLYTNLQALENDLHEHIHLENTILLPRIKKLIDQIDF